VYGFAVVGCFAAIVELYSYSPLFLLSVLAIVWVADIGAYFCRQGLRQAQAGAVDLSR
jgi:phosphatidate cytidylyltransferase